MDGPVCLIVNPHAGGGRAMRLLPAVEAALRGLGRSFRVEPTVSMEHARDLARGARDAGEIVAAMGGDGITGAVAGELRDGSGLLAILPGGRGNDFARKLGIPHDPVAACELLESGRERRVDLADAGGTAFLGILSAGFDSDVNELANATRLPLGTSVYLYGALRALAAWKHAGWTVAIDGDELGFTGYSVAVSNSGVFGGGMWLVPDASVEDGLLDVVLIAAHSKLSYLRGLPRVFKGTHLQDPALKLLRGREISFRADRPFTAYADGDPVAPLPLTVRALPGALRVVAPR
jgi:YegS/Rv2252/BmrU family lipid kinase